MAKRQPIPETFQMRCRKIVDDHVVDAWRDEVTSEGQYWMRAAELLAAYGYGKPVQSLQADHTHHQGPVKASDLTDDQLAEYIAANSTTTNWTDNDD